MLRVGLAGVALLTVVIAIGCGRSGALLPDEPIDVPTPDVPFVSPSPDPTPAPAPFCDPAEPALLACFELEGNTLDASSYGRVPVTSGTAFTAGVAGSALLLTAGTGFVLPNDGPLNPPSKTFEMWLRPDALPATRFGIVDKDGQYGFFLQSDGRLDCLCGGTASTTAGTFAPGAWHHVACVMGSNASAVFVDGFVRDTAGGCTASTGGSGVYIGENGTAGNDQFLGRMDSVRIWARPRTAGEICDAAGATCSSD